MSDKDMDFRDNNSNSVRNEENVSLLDIIFIIGEGKASAAAVGRFFIFHGTHKAVLITYTDRRDIESFSGKRIIG